MWTYWQTNDEKSVKSNIRAVKSVGVVRMEELTVIFGANVKTNQVDMLRFGGIV